MFSADYWLANLRNPVRFSQAVGTAAAEHGNFVEISPHPLLTHAITESLAAAAPSKNVHVGATVNRDNPETLSFHTQLAAIRPPAYRTAESDGALAGGPSPTFRRHRGCTPTIGWRTARRGNEFTGSHPLLGMHVELPSGTGHVWQADVGTEPNPWLDDHKVHGQPVMPGAGFAEMALAAGCEALGLPVQEVEVVRLDVEQMLALDKQTKVTTQLVRDAHGTNRIEIHSHSDGGSWTRHAVATVAAAKAGGPTPTATGGEGGTPVSPADFYAELRRTGAHHGHAFAPLTRIIRTSGWSETEIVLADEATPHRGILLHPVMLDAALQGLAAAMPGESYSDAGEVTYLPVGMESIRVFGDVGRRARCRAEIISVDETSGDTLGRVTLMDDAGRVTAQVAGVNLRRIQRRTVPLPLSQKLFDTTWIETETPSGEFRQRQLPGPHR